MDLRKHSGSALVLALTLILGALPARADKTLWLVRPLYPGQETLVDRTEKALDKLMPGDARQDAVIGHKELAVALKGRGAGELPCFGLEARCSDPIDPFVATLGFERIVLIQGGQDEAGFKFRVVAYDPRSGKVNPASATNANLEKALLGAVAKVVPAASTLEVKSNPPGAIVFIDDVKVGLTPLNTQVLPGERVIRLDLKLHQPIEETITIPIRGTASLEKSLEKVAARIVITASPPGTEIAIDGTPIGKDKVDRGIAPGEHTIRLTAENHKAFEQTVSVKADQQYSLDKTLEPIPGTGVKTDPTQPQVVVVKDPNGGKDQIAVVVRADPPPPPKPSSPADLIYERRSYFHVSGELASLTSSTFVGRRFNTGGFGRTLNFLTPPPTLVGASLEYGTFGKYFGVTVIGLTYLTNVDTTSMSVGYESAAKGCEAALGMCGPTGIDNVRMHLITLRALQPQVRFAFWRIQLGIQAGLEFRSGVITGRDLGQSTTFYNDGFVPLQLLAGFRLNVRFFIVDGLFLHLQGNYTLQLWSEGGTSDAIIAAGQPPIGTPVGTTNNVGGNLGFGYAF
jgi:PEGA domain